MSTSVLVPLKLDAFILNEECCNSDDFKIAPIVQPNYTFLRLDDHLLESDILDHVDLHASKPASLNARVTDLGSGKTRQNRLGVYVHWTLPPFYRTGAGAVEEAQKQDAEDKLKEGFPERSSAKPLLDGAKEDASVPEFRPVPNRWLVTRRLNPGSFVPTDANIPLFESWIVQSDAMRRLSVDPELEDMDLEAEVSPFVDSSMATKDGKIVDEIINSQAEVFVGKKVPFDEWIRDDADKEPNVDLNVMTSANPLLADYQPHNTNIFSIVDNFTFKNKDGKLDFLKEAEADYHVIGWHSEDDDDPMTTVGNIADEEIPTHRKRLEDCHVKLKDYNPKAPTDKKWGEHATTWLAEQGRSNARILCHASMYEVKWSTSKLPTNVLAREAGKMQKSLSFAIGTSPLDALVAYFQAHAIANDFVQGTKDDIQHLIHILGEAGDGDLDGLQAFSDEAYKLAFDKVDAGTAWFWKKQTDAGEHPTFATDDDIKDLDQLNMDQAALDNAQREADDLRWKLFAIWWTWVSSFAVGNLSDEYKTKLNGVLDRLDKVIGFQNVPKGRLDELKALRDSKKDIIKHSSGAASRFYQRKDPTVLFSRIGSGWEADFSDEVQVRLHDQVVKGDRSDEQGWEGYSALVKKLATKVADEVKSGAEASLTEFYELRTSRTVSAPPDPATQVLPFFHDTAKRDRFRDTQPWKPMFIEWEALYYHIPFELWHAEEYHSRNKYGALAVEYTVLEDVSKLFDPEKSTEKPDVIRIAGRNYLQPQAVSTFKTLVQQVFDNTNPDDLKTKFQITPNDKEHLLKLLAEMEFVSAPLPAITNSLRTVKEGSHLKPLVRLPHATPVAVKDAVFHFTELFDNNDVDKAASILQLIDDQGDVTPFASSIALELAHYPFKPVQHGHLEFIKLNIVDKFGQAIHVVDPSPPRFGQFHTTSPIISESLFVGTIDDGKGVRPNTALLQDDRNACPFIALPPSINQPARLNAVFVQKVQEGKDGPYQWRRTSDWDSPVWGWIVVNYAESGIQFFLEDGTFYREVRFGGKTGTVADFKYLPFDPPTKQDGTIITNEKTQLDHLIAKLSNNTYMTALWDMINTSFARESFHHAPTSYSNFSSAIVGKPLALVNAGWSLELANQPKENWTTTDITNDKLKPERTLLTDEPKKKWKDRQWEAMDPKDPKDLNAPEPARKGYTFPVKVGDDSRRYDGLVGYFLPSGEPLQASTSDLNLNELYTFKNFIGTAYEKDPRREISKANSPRHTPYWISPGDPSETLYRHDDKLKVLGLIMDPFLPVHAFSAILPHKALRLPQWTVERALKNMTAFWRVGPLITTQDVDKTFSVPRALDGDYADILRKYVTKKPIGQQLAAAAAAAAAAAPGAQPVPGAPAPQSTDEQDLPTVHFPLAPPVAAANGGGAKFVYMQPYLVNKGSGGAEENTRFNPYGIDGQAAQGGDALEAKLVPGPYTALEGYVQIARSLREEIAGA